MNQDNIKKVGFGTINDQDESLKEKNGDFVVFGLNQGFISKFEYISNAGRDGSAGDAIDVAFKTGEREVRGLFYDVTRVYGKYGEQLTDETDPEYIKEYNKKINQLKASITHIVKALGVTQKQIDNALATPPTNFEGWARIMTSLPPVGFENKAVDMFLEYQWEIKRDKDRTYLTLPKNMVGGQFCVPHISPKGRWKEEHKWEEKDEYNRRMETGLRYVDDSGYVHPFIRSKKFMNSNKAIQQIDSQETSEVDNQEPESKASVW